MTVSAPVLSSAGGGAWPPPRPSPQRPPAGPTAATRARCCWASPRASVGSGCRRVASWPHRRRDALGSSAWFADGRVQGIAELRAPVGELARAFATARRRLGHAGGGGRPPDPRADTAGHRGGVGVGAGADRRSPCRPRRRSCGCRCRSGSPARSGSSRTGLRGRWAQPGGAPDGITHAQIGKHPVTPSVVHRVQRVGRGPRAVALCATHRRRRSPSGRRCASGPWGRPRLG